MNRQVNPPLKVEIVREAFIPWFTLKLPNGQTEELEPDETREWFRQRGASMDAVEKCLDYVWNFRKAVFVIQNPRYVGPTPTRIDPKI